MATYTKKAAKGIIYLSINSAIASIIAYLTRILLARNLLPEEYGLFFSIWTFVAFFLFFTDLGMGSAVTKFIAEYKAKRKYCEIKTTIFSAFLIIAISTSALAMLLGLSANFLANSYFKSQSASLILILFIAYIYFRAITVILRAIFRGLQKMFIYSLIEPLRNLLVFLFVILFISLNFKMLSPALAYISGWVLTAAILISILFKKKSLFRCRKRNTKKIAKKLLYFGMPVLFTGIGERIIAYIDTLMLTYFRTLSEVGIYNVILPSALLFMFFANAFAGVTLPMASELWAKKDNKKISEGLNLFYKYAFLLIIPLIFAIFIFAKFFINIFFGEAYSSGSLAFQILLVGVLLYVIAQVNNVVISGIGKPKEITKIIAIAAGINIIFNAVLIPIYGIIGAAIATSFSYFAVLIFSLKKIKKYIEIKIPFWIWTKTIVLAIVFVTIIKYVTEFIELYAFVEIIISVIISGIVYVALAFLLKLINLDEIRKYIKLAR